jgi:putative peptidoglycan lipid II flippase
VPKLAAVAFIAAVGIVGYNVGRNVGELPRRPGALDALVASTPSAAPGETAGVRIDLRKPPVTVRDYDPYSRDRTEQPDSVQNAYDQDLSTLWSTDGYRTPELGGLKPGVGLLIDLGVPTALASVQVGMSTGGADVELRATNTLGENADDFTVVTRSRNSKQVADLKASSTPSRYWLVWFTALPKAEDGKYRLGVAELVLTRAR